MTRFLLNERNPWAARALLFLSRHRVPILRRLWGIVLGCDIECRLPHRLIMPHPYGIIIHRDARLGEDVVILQQVTIGARNIDNRAAMIGDRVFIGAGAKVLGGLEVGADATIGANAVVTRDVPAGATVVGYNQLVNQVADGK